MSAIGKKIYGVSEITREIKVLLEGRFPGVWVEGEVSNLRRPGSGHLYFTLKDDKAQIQAVIYRSRVERLVFAPEDGLQVVVFGDISLYLKGGRYQLSVSEIEPRGRGALQLAFEQLKKRLAAEGLFDDERKKPVPLLPGRIGIVTSPTGAAIRDILNVVQRRFANVGILISPVRVQGDAAAGEIAAAVDGFNERGDVDVIIVTRGGGSLEDLWAFNEEAVVRAIDRSRIPVISAVGHEIDYTIADFAADLRVPTPSAAAELVVAKESELRDRIELLTARLTHSAKQRIAALRERLLRCERSHALQTPGNIVRQYQQQLDEFAGRIARSLRHGAEIARVRLEAIAGRLDSLSPLAVLGRGYSVIFREPDGAVVRDRAQLKRGARVRARVHKGSFIAVVEKLIDKSELFIPPRRDE